MSRTQIPGAARLTDLLRRHGVTPTRSLGQNFVVDPNTIRKVVALAGLGPGDVVLEVGAGAGSLTVALAAAARRVIAVEVDRRLIPPLLESTAGAANTEIICADALRIDLAALGAGRLVANLPYNVAVPVVAKVLAEAPGIAELTVMTQREVGARLAAPPGSRTYGFPSVLTACYGEAKVLAPVSRTAFYPAPRVDSVVVRIVRRNPPLERPERLLAVARAAFSQRRKTLRNALAGVAGSAGAAERALARAGIDPGLRAERLDLEGFASVTRALESLDR